MLTRQNDLRNILKLLSRLGFKLEEKQPHILGERFLVSPNKLVLIGRDVDGNRVVIKISKIVQGKDEIWQEKKSREVLSNFKLFEGAILYPRELYFGRHGPYLVFVTEYISQNKPFISYPLKKQLSIILKAFSDRESFHSNASKHMQQVSMAFSVLQTSGYLASFSRFQKTILRHYSTPRIKRTLNKANAILLKHRETLDIFCNYFIHQDLVPHNFRTRYNSLYVLDCSSFRFGNKYEEWARLLNYMLIHNPLLEKKLKSFIKNNKSEAEYLDLRLMRIYKAVELIRFYASLLPRTSNNIHALTVCRIKFWEEVLQSLIRNRDLSPKILKEYIQTRNSLRSPDENLRQREFSLA